MKGRLLQMRRDDGNASGQHLDTSEELKNNRHFFELLEVVLWTGNRTNVGTNHGEATTFKLDTLLKVVDIKGTNGKHIHFVVQEIIRSEGTNSDARSNGFSAQALKKQGLQVVSGISRELSNIKKAAGMDKSATIYVHVICM